MNFPQKNVALIGANGFGQSHLTELLDRGPAHGLRLTALADPAPLSEKAGAACVKNVIRHYKDSRTLLDQESLDGIIIAAPIPLHFDLACEAVERGLSVYLEKPPVASVAQLDQLIQVGDDRIHVGFHLMSWAKTLSALRLLGDGSLGAIRALRVLALWPRGSSYYSRSGWAGKCTDALGRPTFDGPATNAASHYLQWMFTAARVGGLGEPASLRAEFFRARPIESYDTCSIAGHFASGTPFCVVMSHACHGLSRTSIRIETEAGELLFDGSRVTFSEAAANPGLLERIAKSITQVAATLPDPEVLHPLECSHTDFGRLLREPGFRPRVRPSDCRDFTNATFGLLEAGAPIASIPQQFFKIVEEGGSNFYAIQGILDDAQHCLTTLQTLSEAGIPWAPKSTSA